MQVRGGIEKGLICKRAKDDQKVKRVYPNYRGATQKVLRRIYGKSDYSRLLIKFKIRKAIKL